jgi:hypothetical protein
VHFTAFHPDFKMRDVPPTPPATLIRTRQIAQQHGLRFVYTGNVHDPDGGRTTCPYCNAAVIDRDWYAIGRYQLTNEGRCTRCGSAIPGRFDGPPVTGALADCRPHSPPRALSWGETLLALRPRHRAQGVWLVCKSPHGLEPPQPARCIHSGTFEHRAKPDV